MNLNLKKKFTQDRLLKTSVSLSVADDGRNPEDSANDAKTDDQGFAKPKRKVCSCLIKSVTIFLAAVKKLDKI